jgi:hypothetical protein
MPTGSLCAERNVIGTALAADITLKREDIKAVAVLSASLESKKKRSNSNLSTISPPTEFTLIGKHSVSENLIQEESLRSYQIHNKTCECSDCLGGNYVVENRQRKDNTRHDPTVRDIAENLDPPSSFSSFTFPDISSDDSLAAGKKTFYFLFGLFNDSYFYFSRK